MATINNVVNGYQHLQHRIWRRIGRSESRATPFILIVFALVWFFADAQAASAYEPPEPPLPSDSSTDEPVESNSLRELFEKLGVDDSYWSFLIDGERLSFDEHEVLYRILFRLPLLSKARIERIASRQPVWEEIEADPESHRGDVIRMRGSLRELETIDVLPEQVIRVQYKRFYRARIELSGSGKLVDVYCRIVPEAWLVAAKAGRAFDEPVSTHGIFLKLEETIDDSPVFAFAALRVAWHPDEVDSELEVTEDLRRLAELGMDIGLFDTVRQKRPIEYEDRECFFQMLNAVGGENAQTDRRRGLVDSDLDGLINRPESQMGRIVTLRGIARRVQRIDVPDDIEERFGITHYYEIDLLYNLKDGIVVYKSGDEDVKMSLYPFVYCCRELPEGMPEGDSVRETVVITGYYFKLYAYRSELMDRESSGSKQDSPLLIGHGLEWIQPKRENEKSGTLLIGCLFVIVILGLWIGIWRYHRSDQEFKRTTLSRQFLPPENFSLDDIDLDSKQNSDRDESG